jgi:hypothetical protein
MTDKHKDAKHWRDRATEIRVRAAQMQDGPSRLSVHGMSAARADDLMLIVGHRYGIRFERKLCQEVELHLAYR